MIEPSLLRSLGWSESLIAEVNRVADEVAAVAEQIEAAAVSESAPVLETSDSLLVGDFAPNTSHSLSVADVLN